MGRTCNKNRCWKIIFSFIEEPSSTPWVTSGIVPISPGPLQSALFTKSTSAKHTNTEWSSLVWLWKVLKDHDQLKFQGKITSRTSEKKMEQLHLWLKQAEPPISRRRQKSIKITSSAQASIWYVPFINSSISSFLFPVKAFCASYSPLCKILNLFHVLYAFLQQSLIHSTITVSIMIYRDVLHETFTQNCRKWVWKLAIQAPTTWMRFTEATHKHFETGFHLKRSATVTYKWREG